MSNSKVNNSTNNSKTTKMKTKFNFLEKGFYDIMEVTEEIVGGQRSYPAKVRRWDISFNKGVWKNETIDLAYLFTALSNGQKALFQPEGLVNHVINITASIPHKSASGKSYNSYNWEINKEVTAKVQEMIQEVINDDLNHDLLDHQEMIDYLNSCDWDDEMNSQDESDY